MGRWSDRDREGRHRQGVEDDIFPLVTGWPDPRSHRARRRRGGDHQCHALDISRNHLTLREEAAREIERDGPLSEQRARIEQGLGIEQEVSTLTSF